MLNNDFNRDKLKVAQHGKGRGAKARRYGMIALSAWLALQPVVAPAFAEALESKSVSQLQTVQNTQNIAADPNAEQPIIPSPTKTPTPTQEPSNLPKPENTEKPDQTQTPGATAAPDQTQTPEATVAPEQTPEVTQDPTEVPTEIPSAPPSLKPEETSPAPTQGPTQSPVAPTLVPTVEPSQTPAPVPSAAPPTASADPVEPVSPENSDEETGVDKSGLKIVDVRPGRRLDWTGVVPYGEGGMRIPQLYQYNYSRVICYYNGTPRSVRSSGCNVTCVSMVAAYLTGNLEQNPVELFQWAVRKGLYHGNGLGHGAMDRVAAQYGVQSRWIGRDKKTILETLQSGTPIIAHMGPGLFTSRGHYIVLRGVTEGGKILVNDPNSEERTNMAFPLDTILREAKTGTPFMICTSDIQVGPPAPVSGSVE